MDISSQPAARCAAAGWWSLAEIAVVLLNFAAVRPAHW
jgi:hypothetical protein